MDSSKPDYNEKEIVEIKGDIKELDKRILSLERSTERNDYQYTEIMKAVSKLNDITIPNLMHEVNELKNRPAKRYDQAISSIIGALFGAVGAFIASKFLG